MYKLLEVLIETYWNVKTDLVVMNGRKHLVLIETYWNVKTELDTDIQMGHLY